MDAANSGMPLRCGQTLAVILMLVAGMLASSAHAHDHGQPANGAAGAGAQPPSGNPAASSAGKIGATDTRNAISVVDVPITMPHPAASTNFIDLSHPLHNGTLHWPQVPDVKYSVLFEGERKSSKGQAFYVKSDGINAATHSGTHLDAPQHFSKTGWSVEQIPLDRLIDVPVKVIDVSSKVKANRSYSFVKADFVDAKTGASLVERHSVVLVYTGISEHYAEGESAYLGTDSRKIGEMKIPGFSEEAANFMVQCDVFGVGVDSPSADSSERHGKDETMDPVAHVILNSNNIYIIENISNRLAELINVSSARLTVAPLPIVGGSGSQVRLVAITGHEECHCHSQNSARSEQRHSSISFLITLFLCLMVFLL